MLHLIFKENQASYPIAILVNGIHKAQIIDAYIEPHGINQDEVLVLDLYQNKTKKKTPVKEIKEYCVDLSFVLFEYGCQYIVVADGDYFKVLTGAKKIEANLGYVLPLLAEYGGGSNVVYVPNYKAIFYDPVNVTKRIQMGMLAMISHRNGCYREPGYKIIESAQYLDNYDDIKAALINLLEMDVPLAVDIEGFSLDFHDSGIGTIAFAWDKHNGIAFTVDYEETSEPEHIEHGIYGVRHDNELVRELLRWFFESFTNKLLYHNISFDVTVLIYQLYMDDITDTEGLLNGLDIMLKNWDDTKLITYLATNSCAGNQLGLKVQAQEFAGNYAQEDIVDIRKIAQPDLLQYNLVDTLSTHFVKEKWWDRMVEDDQLEIYETIFKPAIVDVIQMQLTGMPLYMERVHEVEKILQTDEDAAVSAIVGSPLVQEFVHNANEQWVIHKNNTLKVKRVTIDDAKEEFNPRSPKQVQELLYDQIGLPVLEYTTTKQPATGGGVLKQLVNHTSNPLVKDLLKALINYKDVDKILGTFIPAFKNAKLGKDGWHYLCGNFNLGGTVSGRLSSNSPNLQNLPSGGRYGSLIKSCFQAPPGWLFVGLDFNSLEDMISALTTKDTNKMRVYLDGFDGHSLRAYAYFGEQMPDIDPSKVESINSIQDKYPELRQESKAPTFACTYGGTFSTMMKNLGWSEEKAKGVEANYKELYKESIDWVADKLEQASKVGYVTVAFGLRVRTPLLHQVILGNSKTPHEAAAEGRTAGNALGQSWGMLNTRAATEFMNKVRASNHRLDIRISSQIHDASYYIIRDDIEPLMYLNEHLVKAVQWQEAPEIQHDLVKIGGETSVFFPSWADELTIPNHASEDDIYELIEKHIKKLNEKAT